MGEEVYNAWRALTTFIRNLCFILSGMVKSLVRFANGRDSFIHVLLSCLQAPLEDGCIITHSKKWKRDFPGGPVVKNLPASAEDMGLSLVQEDPTCRRASKPVPCTTEVCAPRTCVPQEKTHQWEVQVPQLESSPCSPRLEKDCMRQGRPSTAKKIQLIN